MLTITAISHVIQAAVAPVFLLSAIGSILMVLTNRLARVVDRVRKVDQMLASDTGQPSLRTELQSQTRRIRLIHRAITYCTSCALLICLVVALLFIGDALEMDFSYAIAGLFVLAMGLMIAGLSYFLQEIRVATAIVYVTIALDDPPPPAPAARKG